MQAQELCKLQLPHIFLRNYCVFFRIESGIIKTKKYEKKEKTYNAIISLMTIQVTTATVTAQQLACTLLFSRLIFWTIFKKNNIETNSGHKHF